MVMTDEEIDHSIGEFERFVLWTVWIVITVIVGFVVVAVTMAFLDDQRFGDLDQLVPLLEGTTVIEAPHQDCAVNGNDCAGMAVVDGSDRTRTIERLEQNAVRLGYAKGSNSSKHERGYYRGELCLSIADDWNWQQNAPDPTLVNVYLDDC